ncbi:MAG: phage tail protein [Myxococcales bacterium]|nr:phage tail protein [Myxococcales bacterium]
MPASPVSNKSYAVSRFGVVIDGVDLTSYVKNVEGGLHKVESTKEQVGSYNHPTNHLATRTIEPITLEVGLCKANPIIDIVEKIVNSRQHKRLSGEIFHADANSKSRFEQDFKNAMITEIGFPALDAAGKDLAMMKLKLQPEEASFRAGDGSSIPMGSEKPQKTWQNNSFRLEIDQQGAVTTHVTKVEALTIGVTAKAIQRGGFLLPEYMPGQIKMPKLSIHVPLHHAGSLIKWFEKVAAKHKASADGAGYESTGALTFLDTTTKKDLYTIKFEGIAPEQMTIVKSEGGSATLKTCKFDFYLTNLQLNK